MNTLTLQSRQVDAPKRGLQDGLECKMQAERESLKLRSGGGMEVEGDKGMGGRSKDRQRVA